MDDWLGAPVSRCEVREGYAELVGRHLRTFGPVTGRDLVWWFGATKGAMRQALSDRNAVQVRLERAQTGWVLPDDVDPERLPGFGTVRPRVQIPGPDQFLSAESDPRCPHSGGVGSRPDHRIRRTRGSGSDRA